MDDQTVVANDECDIEYMVRKLQEIYERAELKTNYAKTKYLVVGGKASDLEVERNII